MAKGTAKDKEAQEDDGRAAADAQYEKWKRLLPVLYDSFTNNNLVWPSLSCRWGPRVEDHTYKVKQRAYLSEQTDGSVPNTLVVANVEVPRPHVADAESMNFNYAARSPLVKKYKTIIHPGEVNRIREYPEAQNIVATHSDTPKVYVWNVDTQPERKEDAKLMSPASTPDLVLTGHHEFAEFALAFHPKEPRLISGGRDKEVLLWHLDDHITSLSAPRSEEPATDGGGTGRKSLNSGGVGSLDGDTLGNATEVAERGRFVGHTDTIEDLVFRPSNADEFCSVGDDAALIFWDARQEGGKAASKVEAAHDADIHTVDWCAADEHLILTGSADHTVRLFDRRKLAPKGKNAVVHTFAGHSSSILNVQWCPDRGSVFASGGEDNLVMVWDAAKVGGEGNGKKGRSGLMFQHAGHRDKVVDFQWNMHDPWTILSVSDDINFAEGGGTLQIWRMNDLIYLPEEEALGELKRHRDYITGKTNRIAEKAAKSTEPASTTGEDTAADEEQKPDDAEKETEEDMKEVEPETREEEEEVKPEEEEIKEVETETREEEIKEVERETREEGIKEVEPGTREEQIKKDEPETREDNREAETEVEIEAMNAEEDLEDKGEEAKDPKVDPETEAKRKSGEEGGSAEPDMQERFELDGREIQELEEPKEEVAPGEEETADVPSEAARAVGELERQEGEGEAVAYVELPHEGTADEMTANTDVEMTEAKETQGPAADETMQDEPVTDGPTE